MSGTNWESTVIWARLSRRSSDEATGVQGTLRTCMPDIERVLAAGGTAPTDFTLHDSGHGFRVAQRMAGVMPEDVLDNLSNYELGLLLLAAYLHDIGMTPEQRRVRLHYEYLLTGRDDELSVAECVEFQSWLDDQGEGMFRL